MDFGRVIPRSRNGTSGICVEDTISAARDGARGSFMFTPERVASIGWQVSIPRVTGNKAYVVIETSMCQTDCIGDGGGNGVWCNVYDVMPIITLDATETGQRFDIDDTTMPTADGSVQLVLDDGTVITYKSNAVYNIGCTVNAVSAIRVKVLYSTCAVNIAFCG